MFNTKTTATEKADELNLSGASISTECESSVGVFDPREMKPIVDPELAKQASHWEVRADEQPYAFLTDTKVDDENRYGQRIDLVDLTGLPAERPLHINDNSDVGINPNRNKQHGFFFTADNCIGCHACEAACSEKNDNPSHLAFRSVGYVEGGSYPDYKRMNISMACNHCDDPVCLKGCPTRAYTKHAEYGAVLQDPETCFGCGYCTWVCPYNAPQLDPVKGQVSKCNMCVDRLEVGLKPACVSACIGNALDFGVIENIPENREQAKCSIPGFPDPEITHPNIRFQQTKTLPEEMGRTDSAPVKYHKDSTGQYKPVVDQKNGNAMYWNIGRLSSRENPLVLFTLLAQAAAGCFAIPFIGAQLNIESFVAFANTPIYALLAIASFLMVGFGMFMSTMHLGKPLRFYRGFNNLRHSPICREGLGIAIFMAALSMHILFTLPSNSLFQNGFSILFSTDIRSLVSTDALLTPMSITGWLAIISSIVGLYYMNRAYRIKARPFWNHWQVASSFSGTTLALGSMAATFVIVTTLSLTGLPYNAPLVIGCLFLVLGISLEGIGLIAHARNMNASEHEGAASHYIQVTTFGKTYVLRNSLMAINLIATLTFTVALFTVDVAATTIITTSLVIAGLQISTSVIGRALFYVLVVPTTMPGAFFWKNKGFEEHARDIGLANMPQVGVIPNGH